MPYADPHKSFDAAVRHLFRYLDDAEALHKNPIADAVLRNVRSEYASGRTAPAIVRKQILEASSACHAQDVASGKAALANRYGAIISSVLARLPLSDVAFHLGISLPQAYRDRRIICTRVAQKLLLDRRTGQPAHTIDPWRAAALRASLLIDQGYAEKAGVELKRVLASVDGFAPSIRIRLDLSRAFTELGDFDQASGELIACKTAISSQPDVGGSLSLAVLVAELRLALATGRYADASRIVACIESNAGNRDGFQDQLWHADLLASHFDSALYYGHIGDFVRSDKARRRALRAVSQTHDYRFAGQASFLAAFAHEGEAVGSLTRLMKYEEALAISMRAGSAKYTLYALLGIANHWADLGDAARVTSYVERAIAVAGTIEGAPNRLTAYVDAAFALMKAHVWQNASALLESAKQLAVRDTLEWSVLKALDGCLLKRHHDYSEAISSLVAAEGAARELHNDSHRTAVLRHLALALNAAGRSNKAKDCISEAVRLADRGTTGSGRFWTQRAAALILAS